MKRKSGIPSEKDIALYHVPAVDRAVRILLMLGTATRDMTIAEIASATGYHKSSVQKILVTLHHHGFLHRDDITKRYSLGVALVRCGHVALENIRLSKSAKTLLKELADYSGETANLTIVSGDKMVIVDSVETPVELRVSPPIGTMDSVINKSSGKVLLAWLPEDQANDIIKRAGLPAMTKNSITDGRLYRRELAIVRKQGYATDCEEFWEGVGAVSAPVFSADGRVVATLSIVGPAIRMKKDKMHLYGRRCALAAAQLSSLS